MAKPSERMGANYWRLLVASTVSNLGDGIGLIAYPWLASALTRNPILIALVAVMQRVPWLLFSLPAGVITDRYDRRKLMVGSNAVRSVITMAVAFAVLGERARLPGPDELTEVSGSGGSLGLYLLVLVATFLLGMAEVLYDNSAQTLMPSIMPVDKLEKANGRLWSSELVANSMAGPPLGAFLLALAFALPFFVDAVSFAVAAAVVAMISTFPRGRPAEADSSPKQHWVSELREGVRWLWHHELLRPLAVILGLLNMFGMVFGSVLVLFAQEVLETSPTEFALMGTGGAIGGVIGGVLADGVSKRLGPGPSLALTLGGTSALSIVIGLTSSWQLVWLITAIMMFLGVIWNVITVSLRQTIIPDHLLGRVNSVYRFFGWGMMPIGALIGGATIVISELFVSRDFALRMPWFVAAVGDLAILVFGGHRLTTAKIEAARAAAAR